LPNPSPGRERFTKSIPPDREFPPWVVIINPESANGSTGRNWPRHEPLLRSILPPFEAWQTTYPGHARELARKAAEKGFDVIAVHGGDGTVNEVVNGLLDSPHPPCTLALLPNGTGADLVRTLKIPHSLTKAAEKTLESNVQTVDIGQAFLTDLQGRPTHRYFLNVADVGFGGDLVQYVNGRTKILGGKITFLQGLLATLFRYANKNVRLTLDEGQPMDLRASSIVVANGQYFGGGMWVAPGADMRDGRFEIVVIGEVSRWEIVTNTSRLYRGTISEHPKVTTAAARTIQLDSEEEVLIDMDGELVGRLPARFEILPQKLSVIC
jgi:diacylglycerol kinase (ATP)